MTLLWSNKAAFLDRRLAPRPLSVHLASAAVLWRTSRAGLPVLKTVSPPSNVSGRQQLDLAAECDALGTERVERAVASLSRPMSRLALIASYCASAYLSHGALASLRGRRQAAS